MKRGNSALRRAAYRTLKSGPVCGELIETLESRVFLTAAPVNVTVDASQRLQKIEGFGTSVADAYSLYATPAYQQMYYQDLGSSMLRVPLRLESLTGPGDVLASPVTLGPDLQADIAQFDFTEPSIVSDGTMAAASKTYGLDSVKLIGGIWSPPHWMKGPEVNWYNGLPDGTVPTIAGVGGMQSAGGSLIDTPDNLTQFGRYVAAYVKGFEQTFGVPFYAISIQNELAFSEPAYSSCEYSPQLFVDAVKAVHNAFVQYGITTKILGPEDVGVGQTYDPWQAWRQMQYIDAVRADPVAMADLDAYAIHGLADDASTPGRSVAMWDQYENGRSQDQYPAPWNAWWTGIANDGKESWQTEMTSINQGYAGAMLLAENAQDALVHGNVSAWLAWQTSDGSAASQYTLTSGTDETSLKFAAAQQFFRYIRPDSFRVSATPSDPNGVYVSAYLQGQQQTLTTVLINAGTTDQTVNLSVAGVDVSSFGVDRRTSATETFADVGPITVVNGVATFTLPAGSIVTLQGHETAARVDAITQGNWVGTYGADGYEVFGGNTSLPSYAQVSSSGNSTWVWNNVPIDGRSLETDPTSGKRVDGADYSPTNYSLDVNLTDGKSHQVALYLADYDSSNRTETVQVTDAATGTVLDKETVSNFVGGKYLTWNLSGHVDITLTRTGGNNAVASGIFFGPPQSQPTASAAFVRTDAITGGAWSGTYGSDGYSVFGGTTNLPAYAQVSASGNSTWLWNNVALDRRSLQTGASASTTVDAVDYSTSSFVLDVNLTDAQTHQVGVYLADYDSSNRVETVQVIDAGTGTVLNSQSVSGFVGGDYLVWNLSGHVKLLFTRTGGNNAVASGIFFGPPPAQATSAASFVRSDTTTGGAWSDTYGTDGYNVFNASSNLPAYAQVSATGNQSWVWNNVPIDGRSLQSARSSVSRLDAAYYSTGKFILDVNLTDGKSHQVALYLADYDVSNRVEAVQVVDAATGTILDTQSVSNFTAGRYLVWNLSGHVRIVLTRTGGNNAVASGLFFDSIPAAPAPATAAFVHADASTGGAWAGVYGADGHNVFDGTVQMPSYAAMSAAGNLNWVWDNVPLDSRSLQTGGGSTVDAAYYSTTSFSLGLNLTDGQTHRVALYLADYDHSNRVETVQISDAATGTILDTRSVANFSGGEYLVWNLSGHVKITLTHTGGNNAVASGLFFG